MVFDEQWENFVEWTEEKGISFFRNLTDWSEDKGFSPLVLLLIPLLLLATLGYFIFFSGQGTGNLSVLVLDPDKKPLSGIDVTITSSDYSLHLTEKTDLQGTATFPKIGFDTYSVLAKIPGSQDLTDTVILTKASQILTLTSKETLTASVKINVIIDGPSDAKIELRTLQGNLDSVKQGPVVDFDVPPNTTWKVVATSDGFKQATSTVSVQQSDVDTKLVLDKIPQDGKLNVVVYLRQVDNLDSGIANATVNFYSNGRLVNSLKTNDDGKTQELPFDYGSNLTVQGVAQGFLTNSLTKVVDSEDTISLQLEKLPDGAEKAIKVIVQDENKNRISKPSIRLYSNGLLVEEKNPESGVTSFDLQNGKIILTAYKTGYSPVQVLNPNSKDFNFITLKQTVNSESLKVLVKSFTGLGEPGAQVSLLDSKGNPLGIPEKTSGLDGSTVFQDLPRGSITVKVGNDYFTTLLPSTEKDDQGNNLFTIKLSPSKKTISFKTFDSYSNQSVKATINVASNSCSIAKDSCSLTVSEDSLQGIATADGYDSTSFTTDLNAPNTIYLTPSNIESNAALNFLGVFDAKGTKVSSLYPHSTYKAKFLFKDLKTTYTKATAHIRLSTLNSQEADTAQIIAVTPNAFNLGENYYDSFSNTTNNTAKGSQQKIRFVEFQKTPGSGNQELTVTFTTIGEKGNKVEFQHKTKYETLNKIIRNPDSTSDDLSAPVATSFSLPIDFQGDCTKEGCIKAILKSPSSQSQSTVEANIGDDVVLSFTGFAPKGSKITVSTSNPGIKITDNSLDDSPLEYDTASSVSSAFGVTGKQDFTGFVVFKPSKYSEARLKITLQTNSDSVSRSFTLRTVGKGTLDVEFTPKAINFEKTNFKVSVRDSLSQEPIDGAKIILGANELDALAGKRIQVVEDNPGEYAAEFTPEKQGAIPLKITAVGYASYTANIPVNVESIIQVTPSSLVLNVNQDSSSQDAITVTNLLNERASVSGSVLNDKQLKYSQITLKPQNFDLKPKESKTISVIVTPQDDILKTGGEKAIKIIEDFQGTISFQAKAGLLSDSQDVSLQGKGTLSLNALGNDWSVSSTDVDFDLTLPSKPTATQKITVTNNGKEDLLINTQNNVRGIRVDPVSAIIPVGLKQDFVVTASSLGIIYDNSCLFDEVKDTGKVNFIASFKGISSSKPINIIKRVSFDGSCMPSNPIRFPVLTDMYIDLLPIYKYKQNQDGSIVVQNEQGEKIAFSNAIVSGTQLSIPVGSDVMLETSRVKLLDFQGSKWFVSLPVPVKFALPLGFKDDSQRPLSVLYQDELFKITFPLTAQMLNNYFNPASFIQGFPQAQAQQLFYSGSVRLRDPVLVIQVLPNEIIKMEKLTTVELKLLQTIKGIGESCYTVEQFPGLKSDVQFDANTKLSFAGKDSQTFYWESPTQLTITSRNKLAAQLPAIRRIYFSQPVQVENLASNPRFTVTAGTSFMINICTNVDESKLIHKLCLPKPTLYTFSQGSDYDTGNRILTPQKCEAINLQVNDLIDSWPLGFSKAKFPKTATIYPKSLTDPLPIAAGLDKNECAEFTYCVNPSKLDSYYEKDSIQGLPFLLLVKPPADASSSTYEKVILKQGELLDSSYSKDFPITININDKATDYRKNVILYFTNNASGDLLNAGLDYERSTVKVTSKFSKEEVFPKDQSLQTWLDNQGGQRASPTSKLFRDKIGKGIEKFMLTFQAPASLIRSTTGCLKDSFSIAVNLIFTGYDPSSKLNAQDVVVPFMVNFDASGCGEASKDLFSQLRVSNTVESGENLFFKALNTNQYITIVNNMPQSFNFKTTDEERRVSCTSLNGNTVTKGGVAILKCTANNYGNGNNGIIKVDFGNDEVKQVEYSIYSPNNNENFYEKSGSPEGFVQYKSEKQPTFDLCENSFCSYEQTNAALIAFVKTISDTYIKPLQEAKNTVEFEKEKQKIIAQETVDSSEDKKIIKSVVIRKGTSTTLSTNRKEKTKLKDNLKSSGGFNSVEVNGNQMDSCGYYKISAQIPLTVSTQITWEGRKRISLILNIEKIKDCDAILANSQIMLERYNGTKEDTKTSPIFYAGREVTNIADVDFARFWKGLNLDTLTSLLNLRDPIFLLGEYSNKDSDKDVKNAQAISQEFYSETTPIVIGARRYYDNNLCANTAKNRIVSELLTVGGILTAGSAGTILLTGGASAFSIGALGVVAAGKLATTAGFCAANVLGASLSSGKDSLMCISINDCLNAAVIVGGDVIGGGKTGIGTGKVAFSDFAKAFNPVTGGARAWATDIGLVGAGVASGLLSEAEFRDFPTTGWAEAAENQNTVNWWTANNQELITIAGLQIPKALNLKLRQTDEEQIRKILKESGISEGEPLENAIKKIRTTGLSAFIKEDIKTEEQAKNIVDKMVKGTKAKASGLVDKITSTSKGVAFKQDLQDKIAKGTFATQAEFEKYVSDNIDNLFTPAELQKLLQQEAVEGGNLVGYTELTKTFATTPQVTQTFEELAIKQLANDPVLVEDFLKNTLKISDVNTYLGNQNLFKNSISTNGRWIGEWNVFAKSHISEAKIGMEDLQVALKAKRSAIVLTEEILSPASMEARKAALDALKLGGKDLQTASADLSASLKKDFIKQTSGRTTGQFLKSLGTALLEGAILAKLIGFDVTPVRSQLDYYAPAHVVVFSQDKGSSPTSVEVCKDDSCSNPVLLTCDKAACFYTLSATQKSRALPSPGYNVLVAGINTKGQATNDIIGSIVNPKDPLTDAPLAING